MENWKSARDAQTKLHTRLYTGRDRDSTNVVVRARTKRSYTHGYDDGRIGGGGGGGVVGDSKKNMIFQSLFLDLVRASDERVQSTLCTESNCMCVRHEQQNQSKHACENTLAVRRFEDQKQ